MTDVGIVLGGRLVDGDAARVSVLDRGFLHGDGVSDTTRARAGVPFALEAHLDRLAGSCVELAIRAPSRESLRDDAALALSALSPASEHAALRMQVTRAATGIGLDDVNLDAEPTVLVIARTIAAMDPRASVRLLRADTPFSAPFQAKVLSYAATIRARMQARRAGKDDVVFVDHDESVVEGGSANVLAIIGGKVRAPRGAALVGITRGVALDLVRAMGCEVIEGPLRWTELLGADEAFLTSSLRGIARIVELDGEPLPAQGMLGDALRDAYVARFLRETTP